jgi:hypothetical protein
MAEPSSIEKAYNTRGFVRIPSSDDGNCFYYTLSNWMKLFDYPLKNKEGKEISKNHMNLRNMVVDYMSEIHKDNPFTFADYFTDYTPAGKPKYKSEESKHRYIKGAITQLRKNGLWDSILSDHIPNMAAQTFNIHITLYDWNAETHDFVVHELNEDGEYHINILRDTNHFELLIPKGDFTNAIKARLGNIEAGNSPKKAEAAGNSPKKAKTAATTRTNRSPSRKRSSSRGSTKHQGGTRKGRQNIARFTKLIGKRVTRKNLKGIRELQNENMLTNSLISLNKLRKWQTRK